MLQCCYEYNHANNIFRKLFGLYLYGSGSQRQSITIASRLGLSDSYPGITGKAQLSGSMEGSGHRIQGGTLRMLSETMRNVYRKVAATGVFGTVYDNINWVSKIAEQTLGRKGAFAVVQ